jgi:hypothetical protein
MYPIIQFQETTMPTFDLHMYAVERAFEALKSGESRDTVLMPIILELQGKYVRTHAICIEHVDEDGLSYTPVFIAPAGDMRAFVTTLEVQRANERRLAVCAQVAAEAVGG